MSKPSKLSLLWGNTGNKVDPGVTKTELGWGSELAPYQWLNFEVNKHAQMLDHINTYGIPEWDMETIYLLGSHVLHLGIEYICDVSSSLANTPGVSTDWTDPEEEVNQILENLELDLPDYAKPNEDVNFSSVTVANNVSSVSTDIVNSLSLGDTILGSTFGPAITVDVYAQGFVNVPRGFFGTSGFKGFLYVYDYTYGWTPTGSSNSVNFAFSWSNGTTSRIYNRNTTTQTVTYRMII